MLRPLVERELGEPLYARPRSTVMTAADAALREFAREALA